MRGLVMTRTYDTKVWDLAAQFIYDLPQIPAKLRPRLTDKLAREIQDRIEGFLADEIEKVGEAK